MKNYDYAKLGRAARREQGMRKSVFAKKVTAGQMTAETAAQMAQDMADIAEILESLAEFKTKQAQVPDGAALIAAERERQVAQKEWSAAHDDLHDQGEITRAAISYAFAGLAAAVPNPRIGRYDAEYLNQSAKNWWPWRWSFFHTDDKAIRKLVKAGALLAAEIDRLLRKNQQAQIQKQLAHEQKS